MRISYEWDIETIDSHGDIEDHDFDSTIHTLIARHPLQACDNVVLVVSWGDEVEGIVDREWAYAIKGPKMALPAEFDGGHRVPKRFHEELAKFNDR